MLEYSYIKEVRLVRTDTGGAAAVTDHDLHGINDLRRGFEKLICRHYCVIRATLSLGGIKGNIKDHNYQACSC